MQKILQKSIAAYQVSSIPTSLNIRKMYLVEKLREGKSIKIAHNKKLLAQQWLTNSGLVTN